MSCYQKTLDFYKANPDKAIEVLKSCNYECEAGSLENNLAFQAIEQFVYEHIMEG
jgi:hypothetical protein